jgi:GNAT superfamily N-acetyltransferase
MIREATAQDIPTVVEFGERFHAQSQQPFPYDKEAVEGFIGNIISSPSGAIFLSETGMIGGILAPAYCAPDWLMAVELFWWAEKGGVKLLKAFEAWAEDMNANEVRMTSLAALVRAGGLLKRLDYAPTEISYRKLV